MEKLYDAWAGRNPEWETKYEDSIIRTFCDYGRGTTSLQEARGKVFGAGYEILIIAFFLGLYYDKRRPLVGDSSKRKTLGQPIKYWGCWLRGIKHRHRLGNHGFQSLIKMEML